MKQNDLIDQLLSRYLDGATSLEEERHLREYFAGNDIDPAHTGFRDMFRALDDIAIPAGLESRISNTIDSLDRRRRSGRLILRRFAIRAGAIAACIAAVLTIAIPSATSTTDEDVLCGMTPEEVAAHTTMALQLMSRTINAGQGSAARAIESLQTSK
ncbi:MAG: hypothetical protein K2I52_00075 [Muribaculaceae bacterium]|nr:hypothetical protein [Muribaculaceae bacterium]